MFDTRHASKQTSIEHQVNDWGKQGKSQCLKQYLVKLYIYRATIVKTKNVWYQKVTSVTLTCSGNNNNGNNGNTNNGGSNTDPNNNTFDIGTGPDGKKCKIPRVK